MPPSIVHDRVVWLWRTVRECVCVIPTLRVQVVRLTLEVVDHVPYFVLALFLLRLTLSNLRVVFTVDERGRARTHIVVTVLHKVLKHAATKQRHHALRINQVLWFA